MNQQMKDLLRQNEYLMIVQKKYNGCHVKIPSNNYIKYDMTDVSFIKNPNGLSITCTVNGEVSSDYIDAPEYVIRPMIYGYLLLICQKIHYPYELIDFINLKNKSLTIESDYLPIINLPKDKEELNKEVQLMNIFLPAITSGFTDEKRQEAKKFDVENGYNILQSRFTNGESQ